MCSIVGVIRKDVNDISEFETNFFDLMVAGESRGTDAFGFYSNKTDKITKAKGTISDFVQFFSEGMNYINNEIADSTILLGHTRNKTMGSEDFMKNNHPFQTKDFIFAHNGVIWNSEDLIKEYKIESNVETDSFALVSVIQKFHDEGMDTVSAIKKILEQTSGYSSWLYEKEKNKIYFFRDTFPLAFYFGKKYFVFASEENYIANEIELKHLRETKQDIIYELDISNWKFRKVRKFKPKIVGWGNYSSWDKYDSWRQLSFNEENSEENLEEKSSLPEFFHNLFLKWVVEECPQWVKVEYLSVCNFVLETEDFEIQKRFSEIGFSFSPNGRLHLRNVSAIKNFLLKMGVMK